MTKAALVEEVSRVADLTKKHSEVIVDTVFRSIITALRRGEKIELRGFGSFRLRQREPRKGRNPKTGDRVDVHLGVLGCLIGRGNACKITNFSAPGAFVEALGIAPLAHRQVGVNVDLMKAARAQVVGRRTGAGAVRQIGRDEGADDQKTGVGK